MNAITIASLILSPLVGLMTLFFIFRIILTWYPQIHLSTFPWNVIFLPTEPFLLPTRTIIPAIGGVDITPIIWVGIFSLIREMLLGQQGILTMLR